MVAVSVVWMATERRPAPDDPIADKIDAERRKYDALIREEQEKAAQKQREIEQHEELILALEAALKAAEDAPRPYKTPLVPIVPILGVLVCFAMMASLDYETWISLVVWLAIGLAIYFGYGTKHSHLRMPRR